jgi:hypothetical protein
MQNNRISLTQPGNKGDLRVLTLSSKNRKLTSKRDIRQFLFDKEQLMMFRKIRDARSQVDNVCRIKKICPVDSVRRLKF